MSSYKHIIDIVSRTISLLEDQKDSKYETTLFLNCCLGLLIIPQQETKRTKPVNLGETVSYEDWGINPSEIKGSMPTSNLDEIARHFRNSLSHGRFDIIECNPGSLIENIRIRDFDNENDDNNKPNFDLTLSIDEFKKFVLKYAKEIDNKLKNL